MPTKRIPRRDPVNTTMSISLPASMKRAIEDAARSERRTISNYMVLQLQKLLEDGKNGKG